MFQFSNSSISKLRTCDVRLQLVLMRAIEITEIDFGVAFGHRSVEEQQRLYAIGRTEPGHIVTYLDGVNKKSKHNEDPSQAVDVYAYVNGKAVWTERYLCYLAGLFQAVAKDKNIELTWGGNWDRDGEIASDHNFIDMPHFQI